MPGRHLPPDPSRGDERTIGGYMAVHDRPAAFEGPDGMSYSVEICADEDAVADSADPYAAYFLFLRWTRMGTQGIEGHLESDYLARGATAEEARERLGRLPLGAVKDTLDALVRARSPVERRWWDVMRDPRGDA